MHPVHHIQEERIGGNKVVNAQQITEILIQHRRLNANGHVIKKWDDLMNHLILSINKLFISNINFNQESLEALAILRFNFSHLVKIYYRKREILDKIKCLFYGTDGLIQEAKKKLNDVTKINFCEAHNQVRIFEKHMQIQIKAESKLELTSGELGELLENTYRDRLKEKLQFSKGGTLNIFIKGIFNHVLQQFADEVENIKDETQLNNHLSRSLNHFPLQLIHTLKTSQRRLTTQEYRVIENISATITLNPLFRSTFATYLTTVRNEHLQKNRPLA